jgi:MFS family permease
MTITSLEQELVAPQKAIAGGLRTFAIVAAGQLVSILGSALTAFALGTWVYQQTGSVTYLGLIILAATVPGIMIAPLSGSIVDRSDRRRTMLASNFVTCLVELTLWALIVSGHAGLGYFFVLAAVISIADAFQEPAWMASVPLLVPKRHLSRASGFVQLSQGLARIIAPGLAGIMLVTVGVGVVLLVDASTFLVAVTTLLVVRIPRPAETAAGSRGKGSLWREAAAGWSYLCERRGLVALLLLFSSVNFLVALVNVLYIPLVLSFASPAVLGTVLTIGGIGMMAGSITVMSVGIPQRKIPALMGLIFLGGVVIGLSGVRPHAALIAGSGFAMMFILPVLQSTSQVLWQTKVAADVQGRVFALRRMLAQASLPAAYLAAGPLADHVFEPLLRKGGLLTHTLGPWIGTGPGRGIGLMFIVLGAVGCLLAAIGYWHPRIRHLEQELPDMIADVA